MRKHCVLKVGVLAVVLAGGAGSTGCSTMNNTEKGAVAGGAIGTGVGLLAGAATGNPRTGAAVGGLVGGGLGAVAGNDQDRVEQRNRDVVQAQAVANVQAQQQRLGLTDVIHLAQQGHDDQVIINQIRSTGSSFQLTASDLDFLKNNQVSSRVIAEMQSARPAPTRVVVRDAPTTVIYQEPAYPGPVYVRPVYVGPRPVIYGGYCRHW
ncbi:MAG: hypothetical protein C0467_24575 [Planctomycetaceae bacterium]|nr:hypothetical protein [Planctomycetaceae bacterium]